ncbi:hypothetical protein LOAG_12177 [Loa loa]|uniref:Uncharacterized protein n=1 Tax=Loa loa TaxID=7209 RepID=A0A1S0TN74_LOALO|nr:hypothetical protein LOAG_12177 [Loa loa]EFO16330.1 hypothetical protein LOAG_12177 [Loa loa]
MQQFPDMQLASHICTHHLVYHCPEHQISNTIITETVYRTIGWRFFERRMVWSTCYALPHSPQ